MLDLDFCSVDDLLMERKSLRRTLAAVPGLRGIRIAVLGGSTLDELVNFIELILLANGFNPVFYRSEYGRFYEDAVHDPQALVNFKPELIYVHTSCLNIQTRPPLNCSEADFAGYIDAEIARFRQVWDALESNIGCQVIQNNFELPPFSLLGNMDAASAAGLSRFHMQLNLAFAAEAARRPKLLLQDIHGLSSRLGLDQWFDWNRFYSYKLLLTPEAHLEVARSFASIVRALYGRSRKVLILDLDNTLWGGVIGDDGVDHIQIGRETPVAEAYSAFQQYCLSLRDRGVLLAVCSKNDEAIARSGFEHPSSILHFEHFSCFKANWEPKHVNIQAIATELSLGLDSFVFVDDNPAERAIVAGQLPSVAVPDIGSEVSRFIGILDRGRYFEPVSLSREDFQRAALYTDNVQRSSLQASFSNYGEYLDSLAMSAEIDTFHPVYLERIAQLTNKTNQFNLTTRRYTLAEIESISSNPDYIPLYGKLSDRFGDNGLIAIMVGRKQENALHIDLFLMSCRVLKRDMEFAMLDAIAGLAISAGLRTLTGVYLPTKKNGMVQDLYAQLGFTAAPANTDDAELSMWTLDLVNYQQKNKHIKVTRF